VSRRPLTTLLLTILLLATPGCGGDPTNGQAPSAPARNLLLITIDTLRADHLSACGAADRLSPHLDALSRRGALFPSLVTPANTTLPAHASLFTSLPPEGHGGFKNGMAIRTGLPTLALTCRGAGMATAAMVSSWVVGPDWNLLQGFDEYVLVYKTLDRSKSPPRRKQDAIRKPTPRAGDTTRHAARWLREHGDRPFMLWLHYMDPHQAYDPPPPYHRPDNAGIERPRRPAQFLELHRDGECLSTGAANAVRADYAGEVAYTDRCIGEVFTLLRDLGLEEATLVAVTADHGEALAERDSYYGHTWSLTEAVNRVPLLLAGPGIDPGLRKPPGTLLDVAPTILALLGLETPPGFTGRDLLQSDPTSAPPLFTRGENGRRAWLVDGMKATFDPKGQLTGLYDLEHDPNETRNLEGIDPERDRELARRYAEPHSALITGWQYDDDTAFQPDEKTTDRLRQLGYIEE